jgi:hypothetical protein
MHTEKNQTSAPPPLTPAELEERKNAARTAQQRLIQLAESTKQARRSIIQTCAESLGVPQERDMNRLIWHGIVQYANADPSAAGIGKAFLAFQAFSMLCVMRLREPDDLICLPDLSFDELENRERRAQIYTLPVVVGMMLLHG